jgi:hypothetical protein
VTYHFIASLGPSVVNGMGSIIPYFDHIIRDLRGIFDSPNPDESPVFAVLISQ